MLDKILQQLQQGSITIEEAKSRLVTFQDLGFAKVDHHRQQRQGFPEIIYGEGKTADQIISIIEALLLSSNKILVTRVTPDKAEQIIQVFPSLIYHSQARLLYCVSDDWNKMRKGYIAVIAAGTSDLHIAEEAAITAEVLGSEVRRFYDVGVAGIHRLLHHTQEIQGAVASVVVAGMEGALPSVVGGLVAHPVIAVPTSVGYGANFNGLSALLTMLNSCASGISVVNIDNGFGGGYNAALIHQLVHKGVNEA